MKCIVIICSMIMSLNLWASARDTQILKCLGEEERRLHLAKDTGPIYDLNQRMIAEMVQIPNVELNPAEYQKICGGKKFSESWKLLEQSILKGRELFVVSGKVGGMQRDMALGMVDDYVDATREILLTFISQIQALSPTPTCLKEEIPSLDNFFIEIKYLQEDVDMKTIFKGKDEKIFEELKNYPRAFEKCRARLKKKPKSPSTEAPKKS
ncbi:hypothetical protein [Peredibacter starrii]|uniref:Uncharacterized protein n=1 Tax=Peredibacter starrii TaxID=28202 RepID=A0AAX4HS90_9BACT|nr:hypothetical protein [Peredibacter starrii]WPU66199.1 hypothetical protein SOO65_05520 [Peredibacter starrii]